MVRSTLRPLLAATSAIVLSACAFATPYEMSFSKPSGTDATGRSSAKICETAFSAPGDSDKVMECLKARGYDWDVRGFAIRRQSGLAGHLSFPAAAIAVGLTAAGNTTDIVPIMGLAGGSYLAHTGAYARPDQAQVYELAADSYRCLVAGAADWKADGLQKEYNELKDATEALYKKSRDEESTLTKRLKSTDIVYGRINGANGLILLQKSNAIETAARTAIGDRLPSAQAVAASVGFGSKITIKKPEDSKFVKEGTNEQSLNDNASAERTAFNVAEKRFYELLEAYQYNPRTITTDCRFNPSITPQLNAPAEVILDNNKAGFVLKGGVPPYGYLPLPDGLEVSITPLSANAAYIQITLKPTATSGNWPITIIDASQAGDTRTILVKKPAS